MLLGTGTPNADPDRSGPSLAVVAGDRPYLVDFGPGVVRRAAAAARNGIEGLDVARLDRAFLTHLHSDHTAGYADLMLTPWVLGRETPLEVYGPPGIASMTAHLREAYAEDIRMRLDGLEPAPIDGHEVRAVEIEAGVVYRDEVITVHAFPVRHGSWMHAFGFRFELADRTIVVSGDTAPCPALIEAAHGCDILVHEVYSDAGYATRSPEWQRYHSSFHTAASELGALAARVRPRLLVLYHQLFWGVSDASLVAEVRAHYDGEVVSGRDLDVFD